MQVAAQFVSRTGACGGVEVSATDPVWPFEVGCLPSAPDCTVPAVRPPCPDARPPPTYLILATPYLYPSTPTHTHTPPTPHPLSLGIHKPLDVYA